MTPFGARIREIRRRNGLSQQDFARRLGVSGAYLSALEHGRRGKPAFALVQGMIQILGVIWDEADEIVRLADMSDPRVTIDTAGLEPEATLLANRLAREIRDLDEEGLGGLKAALDAAMARRKA